MDVLESHPLAGLSTVPDDCECNTSKFYFQMSFVHTSNTSVNYKTLIHEVGHGLGLLHVFSVDGCMSSDYSPDTYSYDWLDSSWPPCPDNLTEALHDNFMDYVGSQNTFSENQRDRIRHVMKYGIWIRELKYSKK